VIAFVCGTEEDSQRLSVQQAKLRDAGAILCASSTAAARFAGALAMAVVERTNPSPASLALGSLAPRAERGLG
jgi:hypothetical protein